MRTITNLEKVLKLWRTQNLTLEGKTTIFKTLALSKLIFLAHVTALSTEIIKTIEKIQKDFLQNYDLPKIKHGTICNSYENKGLKNVDIQSKIISLQSSWIKKLLDNRFHKLKLIPLHLIQSFS